MPPDTGPRQTVREEIKLRVISPPANGRRTVLLPADKDDPVFFVGEGVQGNTYLCGNCGVVLLENVKPDQVKNIVMKCANCGAYNESPT